MVVFDPVKVVLTNYDEDKVELMHSENNPEDPNGNPQGNSFQPRIIYRAGRLYGESPKKYFRLALAKWCG